jgi:hypothetical protein
MLPRARPGWLLVLLGLALLAPAARAEGLAEVGFHGAPDEMDLGPDGSATAPVTVVLRVATGCAEATSVPVVVSAAGTDGLRAAFDRAEAILDVPPGPGPHEARQTLALHVTGVGPGMVRLDAQPRFPPGSCLGLAGVQDPHATQAVKVSPPLPAAPGGKAGTDGTRPIALQEPPGRSPLVPLLVAGAALGAGLLLRGRSWRDT